ncbi:MAG: VOC family protein [bacterium]|nr:VOC family protein [bacterium]
MSTSDHGRFCWYDLMSQDVDASKAFYTKLLGWRIDTMEMGEGHYDMLFMGERGVGGVVPLDGDELPSHWMPYIAVDDLQVSCDRAGELGGQVCVPPMDIGPGSFAVITDPQGGAFSLWQGKESVGEPAPKGEPGVFCWNECVTTDPAAAQTFYEGLFGWRTETADMEIGGCALTYRLLLRGDGHFGGILELPAEAKEHGACPHWLNYVNVPDVDASLEQATGLGATVVCPPTDIPQAGRFCVIRDPQGAVLALFKNA